MSDKLLNKYEQATFERLWKVAEKNWAHVDFKIRLKDVLKAMNESRLFSLEAAASTNAAAQADFSYALKAHLDFLVYDAFFHPLFAVEFDGPTHETDRQQQRCDRRKDALMKRFGLPLLRIKDHYLNRKYRDFDLLSYFVELWFTRQNALYERHIQTDRFFRSRRSCISVCRTRSWPYWCGEETGVKLRDLYNTGQVDDNYLHYWLGLERNPARYRCIMWIDLPGGGCCFVERSMRLQRFSLCVDELWEILAQATAFDLLEQLQSVIDGERVARTNVEFEERYDYYQRHFAWRRIGHSHVDARYEEIE